MSENNELENFVDRVSTHPNRRKLTIISQSPTEIIADVSRCDTEVTQQGTKINASDLQDIVDKVNDLETKIGDESGTYVYFNNIFQKAIYFPSDVQDQIDARVKSADLLDKVYPVGAVYISVSNTSPATLFGGAWEAISDRFLLAAGNSYAAGSTGGEANHTLTINEIPSHTHAQNAHSHGFNNAQFDMPRYGNDQNPIKSDGLQNINLSLVDHSGDNHNFYSIGGDNRKYQRMKFNQSVIANTATNQNTGGGQAHNNMPPYLAVYMWKRTA